MGRRRRSLSNPPCEDRNGTPPPPGTPFQPDVRCSRGHPSDVACERRASYKWVAEMLRIVTLSAIYVFALSAFATAYAMIPG